MEMFENECGILLKHSAHRDHANERAGVFSENAITLRCAHYSVILTVIRACVDNGELACCVCAAKSIQFIQCPSEKCVSVTSSPHSAKTLSVHKDRICSCHVTCVSTNLHHQIQALPAHYIVFRHFSFSM